MILAFYGGCSVIPLDDVARDWFRNLSADKLQRKVLAGDIDLPIIRIEPSQKSARLFELSWAIPHVAAVSGHRSWGSLKRYTHIRQRGDCMDDWPWIKYVTRK